MKSSKLPDLIGKKFGRWEVLEFSGYTQYKGRRHFHTWKCRCICGIVRSGIQGRHLKNGESSSCGCLRKERVNKALMLPKGEVGFNYIFRNYKRHAKNKNLPFNLSKEEFKLLTLDNCHYCGKIPSMVSKGHSQSGTTAQTVENSKYTYNGIDRKNPNKGYQKDNVVSCCGECNWLKGTYTYEEFLLLVKNIFNHLRL